MSGGIAVLDVSEISRTTAIIGAAVIGFVGSVLLRHSRKIARRQNLRKALHTEVAAMSWVDESDLSVLQEHLRTGGKPPHAFVPTQVFDAEAQSLGLLSNSEREALISYYHSAHVAQEQLERITWEPERQGVRDVFIDRTLPELQQQQARAERLLESKKSLRNWLLWLSRKLLAVR